MCPTDSNKCIIIIPAIVHLVKCFDFAKLEAIFFLLGEFFVEKLFFIIIFLILL